ncbi:MAG: hypothetical protein HRU26_17050 [Psychroserpens sp.]|nr:hypothetical protein [Psychroserpens sp.]
MSEVVFSDKYSPLFEILSAWDETQRLKSIEDPTEHDLKELEYFTKLSKVSTVNISGGRDSGKSFALSCFNIIASADYNHRILFTRQTMTSTRDSIKEAVINRMELLGRDNEYDYADHQFTLSNGEQGKITITGQKTSTGTQTARLKSL